MKSALKPSIKKLIASALMISLLAVFPTKVLCSSKRQVSTKVTITAAFSDNNSAIEGHIILQITNDTKKELSSIPLWLYPNRFNNKNPQLPDRIVNWIYPSGSSIGKIDIEKPIWNGQQLSTNAINYSEMPKGGTPSDTQAAIAVIKLPTKLLPQAQGKLELNFKVQIPKRRGRFGRYRGVTSLAGGWFPRPLTDLTGINTQLPPKKILVNVSVSVPKRHGVVLQNEVFEWTKNSKVVQVKDLEAETINLFLLDKMYITSKQTEFGEAIYVSNARPPKTPTWKDTRGKDPHGLPKGLKPLGRFSFAHRGLFVWDNIIKIISRTTDKNLIKKKQIIVEIPAWDKLVQNGPGPVLLSDRVWRLIPAKKVLSFHDIAVASALATSLVEPIVAQKENVNRRYITNEMIGSYFAKIFADEVVGETKTIKELVSFASFIPYIDNLMYAPEIPFRESYSTSVEQPDELRDELWRFMNTLPRGRRILAKLQDIVGNKAVGNLISSYLANKSSMDSEIEALLGSRSKRFFKQWYGDYPKVNYRLGSIEDTKTQNGKYTHRIQVIRNGASIIEPVTVKIVDKDGNTKNKTWSGENNNDYIEWNSSAPIKKVIMDPDNRLVEEADLTADHPTADNISPLPLRPPTLTQILLWGDTVTFEPFIVISATMRKQYDVTNSFHISGSYTPRGYGGSVSYLRHFGPKKTLNSRTWLMGPVVSLRRYNKVKTEDISLPKDTLFAATLGSIGFLIGKSSKSYFFDPRRGHSYAASIGYTIGKADDGHLVQLGNLGFNATKILSPGIGHNFAFSAGIVSLVGEPPAADLATLSNRSMLRGFGLDETYGRLGLYGVTEYRHNIIEGSFIKGPLHTTVDRFQGVLFTGAGTITEASGYTGLFSRDRIFVEAGYGLRLHLLAFGVVPYLLGLDLAFPIFPVNRYWEVQQNDGSIVHIPRKRFKLVFGVTQTF